MLKSWGRGDACGLWGRGGCRRPGGGLDARWLAGPVQQLRIHMYEPQCHAVRAVLRCAQDANEMRNALQARCPSKIDIGPVYSCNPQDRLKFASEPAACLHALLPG